MEKAIALIAHYEGFSATPYRCPANVWTIGYGSTRWKGKVVTATYPAKVTEAEASSELKLEVDLLSDWLSKSVPSWNRLTDGQKAALLSFSYNLGWLPGAVGFDSLNKATLKTPIDPNVPKILQKYVKAAGLESLGLKRRRRAEGLVWYGKEVKDAVELAVLENP